MRDRVMKVMARWYFRNMYQPAALDPKQVSDHPSAFHLQTVPWISTWETVCQSTALQMIAAHHGIEKPRRHFDFLMGFTYGASYRNDFVWHLRRHSRLGARLFRDPARQRSPCRDE